jgi:GrpB-like predicted nucleotidyltransferase (UPF0157 family)
MSRKIEVVPHDPKWKILYETEAQVIRGILGAACLSVHHIGSTAIPGIKAKPVLDFLVEVQDIGGVDEFDLGMVKLGYEPRGENGIPGRRFFTKDTAGERSHHVHMFQVGHPEIGRHLKFRDYLRAHPEEAQAYSQLKEALAETHRDDPDSYTDGKSEFIGRIDKLAGSLTLPH